MGRPNVLPDPEDARRVKMRLVYLAMVDHDYDRGGAYWGGWSQTSGGMWCAWNERQGYYVFVRAVDRKSAQAAVKAVMPTARFYNRSVV
jgi:hypothetical protein